MAKSKSHVRASPATRESRVVASVRSIVKDLLAGGYPNLPTVARKAGVPLRTLQRRLLDEGLTYSDLVSEVRLNRARELLGDRSRQVDEIASALGYSDAANFTRAFKKRAGMTPTQYRKSLAGPAAS